MAVEPQIILMDEPAAGLNSRETAELAGLNQCTISRLKSGATGKQISAETLNKIKDALNKVRRRKKNDGN